MMRLTRRAAAAALFASHAALPSMPVPQDLEQRPVQSEVREQLQRNLETLRKTELSIFTEPSFAFHIL